MRDIQRYPGQIDPYTPLVPHALRNLTPSYWREVNWEAIAIHPIEPEILEVLEFDLALEGHVGENALYLYSNKILRRKDAVGEEIAAWQVEEAFHEIALHFTLSHHVRNLPDRKTYRRESIANHDETGALRPLISSMAGVSIPKFTKALSAYDGVKGEAFSHTAYEMTADLTGNAALSGLLRHIAIQEAGHGHMFQTWGEDSSGDSLTQRAVRQAALRKPVVIVGEGFLPDEMVTRVVGILSTHPRFEENILSVDRRIDTLPGLEGMHLVEKRMDQVLKQ